MQPCSYAALYATVCCHTKQNHAAMQQHTALYATACCQTMQPCSYAPRFTRQFVVTPSKTMQPCNYTPRFTRQLVVKPCSHAATRRALRDSLLPHQAKPCSHAATHRALHDSLLSNHAAMQLHAALYATVCCHTNHQAKPCSHAATHRALHDSLDMGGMDEHMTFVGLNWGKLAASCFEKENVAIRFREKYTGVLSDKDGLIIRQFLHHMLTRMASSFVSSYTTCRQAFQQSATTFFLTCANV